MMSIPAQGKIVTHFNYVKELVPENERMGWLTFQKMNSNFLLSFDTVLALNDAEHGAVNIGRVVNLDEKHKGFPGNSPYRRFVHDKKPQWGHWITELSVTLPKTGIPYLVKQVPHQIMTLILTLIYC